MFGFREKFVYIECNNCGCLQIASYPKDIERFYPQGYYSYNAPLPTARTSPPARFILLLKYLARMAYHGVSKSYRPPWPVRLGLLPHRRVLDIGSGNGARLLEWYNLGMFRLLGVDPFIDHDKFVAPGVKLIKGSFYALKEKFDVVMMNETLEHLPDQIRVFQKVCELLPARGMFFIRIPVKSWAWEEYGVDWVQLDAPRHYYIHTKKSIALLATMTGFTIENIIYDSWSFQFIGSELYRRNISLAEAKDKSFFSEDEIDQFRRRARQLNEAQKGDQAAFILRKTS